MAQHNLIMWRGSTKLTTPNNNPLQRLVLFHFTQPFLFLSSSLLLLHHSPESNLFRRLRHGCAQAPCHSNNLSPGCLWLLQDGRHRKLGRHRMDQNWGFFLLFLFFYLTFFISRFNLLFASLLNLFAANCALRLACESRFLDRGGASCRRSMQQFLP